MKCLVLGGGGFIGSHIVDALLASGHEVRILERPRVPKPRHYAPEERVEWVEGDFQSASDVEAVVRGMEIVIHLVSTTLPKSSNDDPLFDVETNLLPTLRLLSFARDANVRRIVFISSGGTVYGIPEQDPIAEEHPTDPKVSYGIVKLAIEKYLGMHRHLYDLDYVVFRVSNPYGERQRPDITQGAVAVFAERALRGEPIEIWGDGKIVRDYVYVRDVADAFGRALTYSGEPRIFNIGSGKGYALSEIVAKLETLLGRPIQRRYLSGRKFDVRSNVLDIRRAREYLGWSPQISLEDGLRRTLDWLAHRNHTGEP